MALKIVDGKETRVPGREVPEAQCRQGALGRLDRMDWREFQKIMPYSKKCLMKEARKEKREHRRETTAAEALAMLERAGMQVSISIKSEPCDSHIVDWMEVKVHSKEFEPACVLGKKDSYLMKSIKLIGAEIAGDCLKLDIRVTFKEGHSQTDRIEVELKLKPAEGGQGKEQQAH